MDYVFSSTNNETILVSPNNESNHDQNLDSNHQEDVPTLFGQFPPPFLDDIVLQHHTLSSDHPWKTSCSPANDPQQSKRTVRKKRSAGKKDRHSKIHTAQGLRDRRMRLSLHIARKFFGLQDMLGFDKASKTIEWLFSKSKKAIDQVTEGLKSQNTSQSPSKENMQESDCEEVNSGIELPDPASNKGKELIRVHDDQLTKDIYTKKTPTESDLLARESRDKARARARERTRERLMISNLEKSKQALGANPNEDFEQLQLGFSNNQYIEESSSGTHHLFAQAQLNTTQDPASYLSGYGNYNKNFVNPPAGWLNSNNTFLGFLGSWDTENFTENYGLLPNLAPSTGDVHGQNFLLPSNLVHFQTQNQRD